MLNNQTKKILRKLAHDIKPSVQVGKYGISNGTIQQIDESIKAHELIKVQLLQNATITKEEVAEIILKNLSVEIIQIIGRQIILYKRNDEKKTHII